MACKPYYKGIPYADLAAVRKAVMVDYKTNKRIKVTKGKVEGTKGAKQANIINDIIDIHHNVMQHPDEFIQRQIASALSYGFFNEDYNPTGKIADAYDKMFTEKEQKHNMLPELIDTMYKKDFNAMDNPLSDMYQLEYYNNGGIGKLGIAVFSTASVFNSYIQTNDHRIQLYTGGKNSKAYHLKLAGLEFDGATFSNPMTLKGKTKSKVIEWYQSAAVDNAKLNKLTKLNINKHTLDVINILNQMGFEDEVIWFINQPIIRDYISMVESGASNISGVSRYKAKALAAIKEKYSHSEIATRSKATGGISKTFTKFRDSADNLYDNIVMFGAKGKRYLSDSARTPVGKVDASATLDQAKADAKDTKAIAKQLEELAPNGTKEASTAIDNVGRIAFLGEQLAILEEFERLSKVGSDMKDISTALNIDAKGIGKDIGENLKRINRIDAVVDKHSDTFVNIDTVIGEKVDSSIVDVENAVGVVKVGKNYYKPNGIIGASIAHAMFKPQAIYNKLFPQYSLEYGEFIDDIYRNNGQSKDDMSYTAFTSSFDRAIKRYGYSFAIGQHINIAEEFDKLVVDNREDGDKGNSLATVLLNMQKTFPWAKDNAFIASLQPRPSTVQSKFSKITANFAGGNEADSAVAIGLSTFLTENRVIYTTSDGAYTARDFFRDLLVYSYITGGVQGYSEFIKIIPHGYKEGIGMSTNLTTYFHSITDILSSDIEFKRQFLQHNPKHAYQLTGKSGSKFEFATYVNGEIKINPTVSGATHVLVNKDYKNSDNAGILRDGKHKDDTKAPAEQIAFKSGGNNYYMFEVIKDENGEAKIDAVGNYIYRHIHVLGDGQVSEYDYQASGEEAKSSVRFQNVNNREFIDFTINEEDSRPISEILFEDKKHSTILNTIAKNSTNDFNAYMAKHYARLNFHGNFEVMEAEEFKRYMKKRGETFDTSGVAAFVHAPVDKSSPMMFVYSAQYYNRLGEVKGTDAVFKDIIHEYGHMLMAHSIREGKSDVNDEQNTSVGAFYTAMNSLRKDAIAHAKTLTSDEYIDDLIRRKNDPNNREPFTAEDKLYEGLANTQEFAAEMLANTEFVKLFASVEISDESGEAIGAGKLNLFKAIVNIVMRLFRSFGIKLKENSISKHAVTVLLSQAKVRTRANIVSIVDEAMINNKAKMIIQDDYTDEIKESNPELLDSEVNTLSAKYYADYKANYKDLTKSEYSTIHFRVMGGKAEYEYREKLAFDNANGEYSTNDSSSTTNEKIDDKKSGDIKKKASKAKEDVSTANTETVANELDKAAKKFSSYEDFANEFMNTSKELMEDNRIKFACKV